MIFFLKGKVDKMLIPCQVSAPPTSHQSFFGKLLGGRRSSVVLDQILA